MVLVVVAGCCVVLWVDFVIWVTCFVLVFLGFGVYLFGYAWRFLLFCGFALILMV